MEKKNIVSIILTAALVLGFSLQAFAWGNPPAGRPHFNREKMAQKIIKELNLNDEQKAKFMDQVSQEEKDAKASWEKSKDLRGKLETELKQDNPDQKTVDSIIEEMGKNQSEIEKMRVHSIMELKKMLTPEQKEKLKSIMEKNKDRAKDKNEK